MFVKNLCIWRSAKWYYILLGEMELRYSNQFHNGILFRTEPLSTRHPWRDESFACHPWQAIPDFCRN